MAEDKKDECKGECCNINISKAKNGYKISCTYEGKDSLAQRAGWVPCSMQCDDYVEKTKDAVLNRLKEVL